MTRTLQQARARVARYVGRTGSGSTENTYGGNAMTEVSSNDEAKGARQSAIRETDEHGSREMRRSNWGGNDAEGAATTEGEI